MDVADPYTVFGVNLRRAAKPPRYKNSDISQSREKQNDHCKSTTLHMPNDQRERREAAATDVRLANKRNGCLPFARRTGSTLGLALLPQLKALQIDALTPEHICKSFVNLPLPFEVLIRIHFLCAENLLGERVGIPELGCTYSGVVLGRQTKTKLNADIVKQEVERFLHGSG